MRVRVRGTIYDSVPEAAAALNVSPKSVYVSAHRGRLDTLGVGAGKRSTPGAAYGGRPKRPIKIGPLEFDSLSEASKALGYHRNSLATAIRRGQFSSIEARAMQLVMKTNRREE
jgi:hypothetical protein